MKLKQLVNDLRGHDGGLPVRMELVGLVEGWVHPVWVESYRGYYEDLAITYDAGRGLHSNAGLIEALAGAVGEEFAGYKGGDYTMTADTQVWCANHGESWGWAPCEVVERDGAVIVRAFNVERW